MGKTTKSSKKASFRKKIWRCSITKNFEKNQILKALVITAFSSSKGQAKSTSVQFKTFLCNLVYREKKKPLKNTCQI